ncbi:MAG: hypothetical protein Q8S00_05885 [Deltaproteobacteria bacterium]|nr:hypothetical protein [Deltaproteobacteria bacterium]
MPWPTPQDYNEAIQNPDYAFADPELQSGHAELDQLGLPRARTGGFASVYRMQCGERHWAVRCFLRDFPDQQKRYAAISGHLSRMRVPYTVGFTFLPRGIRVRGQWYPILKMEWVQGEPLNNYIEKHLESSNTLLSLASRWVQLVQTLQQAGLAHGDLQHGNVFVVQGDLRLIDYDGMYVPALSGQVSHEVGHRNYQHPLRTQSDFGAYVDNFSAWVIYVAIIALAVDPRLWERFGGGDECLLFRRKDFEQPDGSDALHALQTFPDERIRSLGNVFRSLLYLEPQQTPPLDGQQLRPPAHIVITCGSCGQALRVPTDRGRGQIRCPSCGWQKDWAPSPSNIPDWVQDHLDHERSQTGKPALDQRDNDTQPIPEPDATWILDFLRPADNTIQAMSFASSVAVERYVLGLSIIGTLLLVLSTQAGIVATSTAPLAILLVALLNVGLWLHRYSLEPAVAEFAELKAKLRATNGEITTTMDNINAANRAKKKRRDKDTVDQAKIAKEQKSVEWKESKEIAACQMAFQSVLSSINIRRQTIIQQEADALRKIQSDVGKKDAALTQEIVRLTQDEATELTTLLKAQQKQHMLAYLRRFTLDATTISGVGPSFKLRLKIAGFQSAADIDAYRVQRVKGIGPSRAASLVAWRRSIESRAQVTMPQALSHSETTAIQTKYQSQRRPLEDERDRGRR